MANRLTAKTVALSWVWKLVRIGEHHQVRKSGCRLRVRRGGQADGDVGCDRQPCVDRKRHQQPAPDARLSRL